jgi:hypothetical protein
MDLYELNNRKNWDLYKKRKKLPSVPSLPEMIFLPII